MERCLSFEGLPALGKGGLLAPLLVHYPGQVHVPPELGKHGEVLPYLILLGRPAAGKSELIQFLKSPPPNERAERYHVGTIQVFDNFPILWEKFIGNDIWEKAGKGRQPAFEELFRLWKSSG